MKIRLNTLHEGLNEIHFDTSIGELGFVDDEEKNFLFPKDISIDVEIQKISDKYHIKSKITTTAHYVCDRCLDEFDQLLEGFFQLYYSKSIRHEIDDDDEYRVLSETAEEIDIKDSVIESLLLSIPMKHLCYNECRGLCPTCGANLNYEKCNCEKEKIDPRWEKLKNLLIND